jgi:hypothetical protein
MGLPRAITVAAAALVAAVLVGPSSASFPGANGRIYFVGRAIGTAAPTHLFSMAADGSNVVQLTSGSAADLSVSVASGGSRVAVSRDTNEQCGHVYWAQGVDLFSMTDDGTALSRLTNDCPLSEATPAWSPGGQHLVFSRGGAIWSMRADTGDLARLTCGPPTPGGDGGDYFPDWSPDGRSIAFGHRSEIEVMSTDGSDEHAVATGSSPSFSPDGTRLAYAGPVFSTTRGIHVVSVDGSDDVRLTTGNDGAPVWSPDGNSIAFLQARDSTAQRYAIATMRADGTDVVRLLNSLDAVDLDWASATSSAAVDGPDVTAAKTTCDEVTSPPGVMPTSPGAPAVAAFPIAAQVVVAPNRLAVAAVRFRPTVLRTRAPFDLRVAVRDLAGRPVTSAVVTATPVRAGLASAAHGLTGSTGLVVLRVRAATRHHPQPGRLVLRVRVRKPGTTWSNAVSGVRLVSVRMR